MDYHHNLRAHHADGSPSLLIWIWVFPCCRQRVVEHEDRCLKAETVRSEVRLVLCLIPSPTQVQPSFILRNCSYRNGTKSILRSAARGGLTPDGVGAGSSYRSRASLSVKVLDFIKSGGPILTVDRTIFEMWLGGL